MTFISGPLSKILNQFTLKQCFSFSFHRKNSTWLIVGWDDDNDDDKKDDSFH